MTTNAISIFRCLAITFLCLTCTHESFAQIGLDLKLGGNLSHADAISFRSSNRLGFQLGGVLRYHFRPSMAIQAEPTFNLTRIRANEQTADEADGISKGNKALHFFDMPLLFRLDIARRFAFLGGVEFNKLLNEEKYLLNNGEEAFKKATRLGYTLGAELGKFYFRYRFVEREARVYRSWSPTIQQYQVGIMWNIL